MTFEEYVAKVLTIQGIRSNGPQPVAQNINGDSVANKSNKIPPGFMQFTDSQGVNYPIAGETYRWLGTVNFRNTYKIGSLFKIFKIYKDIITGLRVVTLVDETGLPIKDSYPYNAGLFDTVYWEWVDPKVNMSEPTKQEEEAPRAQFEKASVKYTKISPRAHYTLREKEARDFEYLAGRTTGDESRNYLLNAKMSRFQAANRMKKDMEIDAEEKALDEGNVLEISKYNQLSEPDKLCWQQRGINSFYHYPQFNSTYFWYEMK